MTKNPQANSQAEVLVRLITQGLITRLNDACEMAKSSNQSFACHATTKPELLVQKWDLLLPAVVYSHNTIFNERLGCSPYELMFGRSAPLAHKVRVEEAKLLHEETKSFHDCLLQSLKILQETAIRRQDRFRSYAKWQYDKYRSSLKIERGDLVFVFPPHNVLIPKLQPAQEGPFRVIDVYRQPGMNEPTAVKVALKEENSQTTVRTYPRYQIRVIKGFNPFLYWKNLSKEADSEMKGTNDCNFFSLKSIDDSDLICFLRNGNL